MSRAYCDQEHRGSDAEADQQCEMYHSAWSAPTRWCPRCQGAKNPSAPICQTCSIIQLMRKRG